MELKNFVHEAIGQIRDGIRAFNAESSHWNAQMPDVIEFDMNIDEDQIHGLKFKVNVTEYRYDKNSIKGK